MYHMDADKTYREKARRELNENSTSYIKQILEAIHQEKNSCTATGLNGLNPVVLRKRLIWYDCVNKLFCLLSI